MKKLGMIGFSCALLVIQTSSCQQEETQNVTKVTVKSAQQKKEKAACCTSNIPSRFASGKVPEAYQSTQK